MDRQWLVNDKFSYADFTFFSWNDLGANFVGGEEHVAKNYPNVSRWMNAMRAKESVKKALEVKAEAPQG